MAPYSFHYDESKTSVGSWMMVNYAIALNDMHNFWLDSESFKQLFAENFLSTRFTIDEVDVNNIGGDKIAMAVMNFSVRLKALERAESWHKKNFPATLRENKKIFDEYLTLCEKNKITPIVFLPAFSEGYKKHFSREKLSEFYRIIQAAQKKHSTMIFVDGWSWGDFVDGDFWDVDHLNLRGAEKFSHALNATIEQIDK